MTNLLSKLHISPMVGLFCLGFLSCLLVIVLSRYTYVPVVAEIDTFFRPSAEVKPTFTDATILGLSPGKSLLSVLATPLVNEKTTLGASVQEQASRTWMDKRKLPLGEEHEMRIENMSSEITLLGQPLSQISIFFKKADELDLAITKILVLFPAESPSVRNTLSDQFGAPTDESDEVVTWKSDKGMNLQLTPTSLHLYQEQQETHQASPTPPQKERTNWLQ